MKNRIRKFFTAPAWSTDVVSLLLRVAFGGFMAYNHGLGKLNDWQIIKNDFATPFGMSNWWAAALTIGAEFFCCLFIVAGLFTRAASIPIIICMAVAAFKIHAGDPLGDREGALSYLIAFVAIFLLGSGKWSLDCVLFGKPR